MLLMSFTYSIMTIKELKRETGLSNADIARFFDFKDVGSYQRSSAKQRYENALIKFYNHIKKQQEMENIMNVGDAFVKVTDINKYPDVEINGHFDYQDTLHGNVSIDHPEHGWNTHSGEHGLCDYEDEWGFVILSPEESKELV